MLIYIHIHAHTHIRKISMQTWGQHKNHFCVECLFKWDIKVRQYHFPLKSLLGHLFLLHGATHWYSSLMENEGKFGYRSLGEWLKKSRHVCDENYTWYASGPTTSPDFQSRSGPPVQLCRLATNNYIQPAVHLHSSIPQCCYSDYIQLMPWLNSETTMYIFDSTYAYFRAVLVCVSSSLPPHDSSNI